MEKKVLVLVVVAFFIGVVFGHFVIPPLEIERLESEIFTLQTNYDDLNTKYNGLQSEYATLEARIAELELSETELLGLYFSPHGGAAGQVINWIDKANETIHVLIYSFTHDDIGNAVVRAYQRGVEIKIVFEKSQVSQYSEYWRLKAAGVLVRNDANSGLMHHKVAVIDGYVILTGSFNWSVSAEERNNENLMVIRGNDLAITYEEEFQRIWSVST